MPPVEEIGIEGTAVYWEKEDSGRYDEPILSPAREIACRWINGQTDMLDANGVAITVQAVAIVTEDLKIGSLMYNGTLEDYGSGSGASDATICLIAITNKVPDLDNRFFYRSVGLTKYGNKLPST